MEKLVESGKKDLVIIAEDIDGEALATFVLNKLRGGFNVLGIKAPGFGDDKQSLLEDIAITVGAKLITEEAGLKLEKAELNMLGRASKVIGKKDSTILVGGKGKKSEIEARVAQLRKQKELLTGKYDIEKIEKTNRQTRGRSRGNQSGCGHGNGDEIYETQGGRRGQCHQSGY